MQFEVGKKYKTRDGRCAFITEVYKENSEVSFPVCGTMDGMPHAWTSDGHWLQNSGDSDSDLVELIPDLPSVSAGETVTLEVGSLHLSTIPSIDNTDPNGTQAWEDELPAKEPPSEFIGGKSDYEYRVESLARDILKHFISMYPMASADDIAFQSFEISEAFHREANKRHGN